MGVFENGSTKWSALFGSVAAMAIMHSLMEYIVIWICIVTGFRLDSFVPKKRGQQAAPGLHKQDSEV